MSDVLVFAPQARAEAARGLLGRACQATGQTVQLEVFGSSGSLFQRLRARRAPPPPDLVVWFGPYAAHSAALGGLLQSFQPAGLPPAAAHDPNWGWVAVEYQPFVVRGEPAIGRFEDIASARLLAVADPERSEVGMMALLAVLERARKDSGDAESGWQWWTERVRSGADLVGDDATAVGLLTQSRTPPTHVLTLQDGGAALVGLAPMPHAISLPTGGRNPDGARALVNWLVSEPAVRPGGLSAWQASSNGLETLLGAAPPLDVDWGTRQYAATRARWAQNAFAPALPRN